MLYDAIESGKRMKEARQKLGMSQVEISERLSISPKYYSRIESGYQPPSLELIIHISNVLNESLDKLLFGTNSHISLHQNRVKTAIQHIIAQLIDIDSEL